MLYQFSIKSMNIFDIFERPITLGYPSDGVQNEIYDAQIDAQITIMTNNKNNRSDKFENVLAI